jgi:hypothetical protein
MSVVTLLQLCTSIYAATPQPLACTAPCELQWLAWWQHMLHDLLHTCDDKAQSATREIDSHAARRFEGFDDAIATVTEESGWSWTGTRALNAMKDMLSPRYSAIMSMSAYPEDKEGAQPPSRSFPGARPAKPRLRVTENGESNQVQTSAYRTPSVLCVLSVVLSPVRPQPACVRALDTSMSIKTDPVQ